VFDLETGRTQVISGSMSEQDRIAAMRQSTLDGYRRMNAELEVSIANMRQESEMADQTRELREQTELLRNMSKEERGGSSSSYVPPPIIVAPSSYAPRQSKSEHSAEMQRVMDQDVEIQVLGLARRAKSFNSATKQVRESQLSAREGAEYGNLTCPNNEAFIKSLLQSYEGSFTDYAWKSVKVDPQTFTVTCSVLLDGKPYDFRFRVNLPVGTCRYEGGTALAKLAPPQAKSKITFLDEETPSANSTRGFDPSKPYTIEDPADKEEKFDPDAYLNDSKASDPNSSAAPQLKGKKSGPVLSKDTLKQAREAGIPDEESWDYLASKDERFAKARAAGRTLDELAEESSR
jgi:hypothetical protein